MEGGDDSGSVHRDPSECLKLKPKKSILKAKQPSVDDNKRSSMDDGRAHFDEMNIIATHHPADKDYGHMKIDEPKTPYNAYSDSEEDAEIRGSRRRVSLVGAVDPVKVAEGLEASSSNYSASPEGNIVYTDDDEDEDLTPEQIAHKREFEMKRKMHYNEGAALRMAKELIAKDEEMDDIDD